MGESQLADPTILPLKVGKRFSKSLPGIVKNVFKHIFRIYVHIYLRHMDKIIELGIDSYVNSCFKHFVHFAHEFQLVELSDYAPLKDLIKAIMDPSLEDNSDDDDDDDDEEDKKEKEEEKEEEEKEGKRRRKRR